MMRLKSGFVAGGLLFLSGCSLDWTVPSGSGTGGAGGAELVQITCKNDETCTCKGGQLCAMTCSGAVCDVVCEADAACQITCTGAECSVTCEAGSTCTADCSGASCTMDCASGALCTCSPDALCM